MRQSALQLAAPNEPRYPPDMTRLVGAGWSSPRATAVAVALLGGCGLLGGCSSVLGLGDFTDVEDDASGGDGSGAAGGGGAGNAAGDGGGGVPAGGAGNAGGDGGGGLATTYACAPSTGNFVFVENSFLFPDPTASTLRVTADLTTGVGYVAIANNADGSAGSNPALGAGRPISRARPANGGGGPSRTSTSSSEAPA